MPTPAMRTTPRLDFESLYPTPVIRGARIARLGEKYLGAVCANADTCRSMGEDHVGWYVGGVPSFDRMIDNMRRINESSIGGRWIVVPATKAWAEVAYEQWFDETCTDTLSTMWQDDIVTFCVPERLAELGKAIDAQSVPIAGVILLDPNCIVHRGRGFANRNFRIAHDRPQLIVDFRASLRLQNWSPPLIVMSRHKAAAVSSQDITRTYYLDAMHFIDGASLNCGGLGGHAEKNRANPDSNLSCRTTRSNINSH